MYEEGVLDFDRRMGRRLDRIDRRLPGSPAPSGLTAQGAPQ